MASNHRPGAQDPRPVVRDWAQLTLQATAGLSAAGRLRVAKAMDAAIAFGALEHAAGNSALQDLEILGTVFDRKLMQLRESPPPADHLRLVTEYQRGVRDGKRQQAELDGDRDGPGGLVLALMLLLGAGVGAWMTAIILRAA